MRNLYSICIISVLTAGYSEVKALPVKERCGIKVANHRNGRIINGNQTKDGEIPWIAHINLNKAICGGSIISDRFILSAAHCFKDNFIVDYVTEARMSPELAKITVTLGEYDPSKEESFSAVYNIERIIIHHDYYKSDDLTVNDIVLLELTNKIQWTDHIQPICLPTEDVRTADKAIAAGWGRSISPFEDEDDFKLRKVELQIFDNDVCNHKYRKRNVNLHLLENQMCAGVEHITHDTSKGDSGGPLYVNLGGKEVLVGITSGGSSDSGYPKPLGIYTRVFGYLDWINTNIGKDWSSSHISNQLVI